MPLHDPKAAPWGYVRNGEGGDPIEVDPDI